MPYTHTNTYGERKRERQRKMKNHLLYIKNWSSNTKSMMVHYYMGSKVRCYFYIYFLLFFYLYFNLVIILQYT